MFPPLIRCGYARLSRQRCTPLPPTLLQTVAGISGVSSFDTSPDGDKDWPLTPVIARNLLLGRHLWPRYSGAGVTGSLQAVDEFFGQAPSPSVSSQEL